MNDKGEREVDVISVSSALQIAGRAGRYGTQWEHGYVTTYRADDLGTLKDLLSQRPDAPVQAGLHPTADQIELYAYHLPDSTLSNLMDIFVSLSTVDDALYFMCNIDDFKFLAEMIQHVPLPLRARYVFCCAPINRKMAFVCSMFLKVGRHTSYKIINFISLIFTLKLKNRFHDSTVKMNQLHLIGWLAIVVGHSNYLKQY